MTTLITVIHIVVSLFLVLTVLLQSGKDGGMGAAFGGGSSASVLGTSGATTFLGKLTYLCAGIFMVTSISLTIVASRSGKSDLLREEAEQAATATPVTSLKTQEAAKVEEPKAAAEKTQK